jgi:hypothetical protein
MRHWVNARSILFIALSFVTELSMVRLGIIVDIGLSIAVLLN